MYCRIKRFSFLRFVAFFKPGRGQSIILFKMFPENLGTSTTTTQHQHEPFISDQVRPHSGPDRLPVSSGAEADTIYLVSVKFFCHFLSVCLGVENLFELFQLLPQNKCSSSSFFIPAWKIDFCRQDLIIDPEELAINL